MAVVTSYYNPAGRRVKWDNFVRFRDAMRGLPLYVVEAAFGRDPFSLDRGDCLLQVRCRDTIWQQYRLINLAVRRLPERHGKVVWVDADILFGEPDWYERLAGALDHYPVVQSFKSVTLLAPDGSAGEVKAAVATQAPSASVNMAACYATGYSWGVRRDVLERHGVYDWWVTGSGDNAFVLGAWGDWDNLFLRERLNGPMRRHFMDWAAPFHAEVGGRVSFLDLHASHLWHGSRDYKGRWRCLRDFDPYADMRVGEAGAFEWCSDKPAMHACCRKMCLDYDADVKMYL